MKKISPPLVLFLIIFLCSFIFTTPVFANCNCVCTDGKTVEVADKSKCTASACQYHNGITNPAVCIDIVPPTTDMSGGEGSSGAGGSSGQVTLSDPLNLGSGAGLNGFIARIISALLGFVGVAALIAFVYAGFMFLMSTGNQEQVKKAKDTMLYAAIGAAIAMGSYAILSYVFRILEAGTGN